MSTIHPVAARAQDSQPALRFKAPLGDVVLRESASPRDGAMSSPSRSPAGNWPEAGELLRKFAADPRRAFNGLRAHLGLDPDASGMSGKKHRASTDSLLAVQRALDALSPFEAAPADALQSWAGLLTATGLASERRDSQGGDDSARLLALIRQEMATFGSAAGEGDQNWRKADHLRPMDFFA